MENSPKVQNIPALRFEPGTAGFLLSLPFLQITGWLFLQIMLFCKLCFFTTKVMRPFLRKINDVAPPGSSKDTNGKKSSTQWDLYSFIYKAQALPLSYSCITRLSWVVNGLSQVYPERARPYRRFGSGFINTRAGLLIFKKIGLIAA